MSLIISLFDVQFSCLNGKWSQMCDWNNMEVQQCVFEKELRIKLTRPVEIQLFFLFSSPNSLGYLWKKSTLLLKQIELKWLEY